MIHAEQLKAHRQEFIFTKENLPTLPLLPEISRFFAGQVACTLAVFRTLLCVSDRPLGGIFIEMVLSSSSCMNCESISHTYASSQPFRTSGKFCVQPNQMMFDAREELTRLVWNTVLRHFSLAEVTNRRGRRVQ